MSEKAPEERLGILETQMITVCRDIEDVGIAVASLDTKMDTFATDMVDFKSQLRNIMYELRNGLGVRIAAKLEEIRAKKVAEAKEAENERRAKETSDREEKADAREARDQQRNFRIQVFGLVFVLFQILFGVFVFLANKGGAQ